MALDIQSLMLQLTPGPKLDFSEGLQMGLERQRLAQMREQIEETKRRNKADEELRRLAEQGEMARANLALQRQRELDAAAAERARQKQQQAVLGQVEKLRQSGDYSGIAALSPALSATGGALEYLGEAEGMPSYRIVPNVAADRQREAERLAATSPYGEGETAQQSLGRLSAMGYPEGEAGTLEDPNTTRAPTATDQMVSAEPGQVDLGGVDDNAEDVSVAEATGATGQPEHMGPAALPFGDAYVQALAAGRYAREHGGQPVRGPDAPDLMGAVPRDVIDTGAIRAQGLQRTLPFLQGAIDAYPDATGSKPGAFRDSARETARGVAALGLDPLATANLFNQSRQRADSIIQAQIDADAQQGRFEQNKELKPTDEEALIQRGTQRAAQQYDKGKVGDALNAAKSAQVVLDLLQDEDPYNDDKAINFLMQLSQNKGPQTERDAERMTGLGVSSTLDQIGSWLNQKISGGFYPEIARSMIQFALRLQEEDAGHVYSYLDEMKRQAATNRPQVAKGYLDFADGIKSSLPDWMREQYEAERADEDEGAPPEQGDASGEPLPSTEQPEGRLDSDFQGELEAQAMENDLDPDNIRIVMGPESGGRADAVNDKSGATGILQFMPSTARNLGTSVEALRGMTPTEQLPYAMRYFKSHGLTAESSPDDYAMAVAAPKFIGKSDDTVVYKKGTKAWKDNEPWRPSDGGDITVGSILAFYGLREKAAAAAAPAPAAAGGLPAPKTPEERELYEALGGKL